jgi:hypothetical protein
MKPLLTRSTVRAIDAPYDGRRRRYGLRRLLVVLCLVALIWLCWAISVRLFPTSGISRLIYVLHDAIFLPLKGRVWTQWFPYVFVWLVPLLVVVSVGLAEYLSKAGLLRRIHARLILRVAARPRLQAVLAPHLGASMIDQDTWGASLSQGGIETQRRFGFARRVVRKEQEALWMKVASALADARSADPKAVARLLEMTNMRLRLDPSDARAHLSALEVIAASETLTASHDFVQTYRRFLENQTCKVDIAPVLEALDKLVEMKTFDLPSASKLSYEITSKFGQTVQTEAQNMGQEPLELALTALVVSALSVRFELPDVRGFQRLWIGARLSAIPQGCAEALGVAETFIFFEMWSMRAEFGGTKSGNFSLMQRALEPTGGAALRHVDTAERFAWGGGQT